MIKLENVHKSYRNGSREFEVIRGVSAEIEDGAFAVILGASGSGKSTLLSLMSGLERPSSGRVVCSGTEISSLSDKERTKFRRDSVGFVFQQYALLADLTVDKNVRMGADLAGNTDYSKDIDAVGLSNLARERCCYLSGGEQQRVAIARAVSKHPKVLFLDEPTGALDEETSRQVLRFLESLRRSAHFTMVMVTHNDHIAEMAGMVLHMNSGRVTEITQNDTPKCAAEIGW